MQQLHAIQFEVYESYVGAVTCIYISSAIIIAESTFDSLRAECMYISAMASQLMRE